MECFSLFLFCHFVSAAISKQGTLHNTKIYIDTYISLSSRNVHIFRVFHIFIYFEGNEINWVVGERNKGNCNDVCNKNHPGSTCDETSLNDLDEQKAKEIKISNGNQCRDWNSFNYGQGLSQCTAPSCCVSGSCQYNCSFSVTTACVISDDFNADHSRICPCISGGRLLYRIK